MTGIIGFTDYIIEDNMPWYNKYFDQIFYGTIAFILGLSAFQARKTYKETRKPKFRVETNFKDTAK